MSTDFFAAAIAVIPNVATSPLALVAYVATISAWVFVFRRIRLVNKATELIIALPSDDRAERAPDIIQLILNQVIVGKYKAEDFLRLQKAKYRFYAAIAVIFAAVTVFAMASWKVLDRETLTDDLIEQNVRSTTSKFKGEFNMLENAGQTLKLFVRTMDPNPSFAEVEALTSELAALGISYEAVIEKLAERSRGGQIQKLNQRLIRAASIVDRQFSEIRECFQQQRCVNTTDSMSPLCRRLNAVSMAVKSINSSAAEIPGVLLVQTGTNPMFGQGVMDVVFELLSVSNTQYLVRFCSERQSIGL